MLAPRVIEEERDRQLTQHQELVELAHSVPPEQLASLVSEATRHAVEERLGVAPREATMAEVLAEGERLAEAHVPNWNEVRDSVMDELVARPSWLSDVNNNPTPATLGQAFVSVASVLAAADTARAQAAESKRAAQTMSGAGARPASQNDDEAQWARIRAAGSQGYGS